MKKKLAAFLTLIAFTSKAEQLDESFIDVVFKKDFYSFSQVMMDEEENPYIALDHLSEWSGMDYICFENICSMKYLNEQIDFSFSENKIYHNGKEFFISNDEFGFVNDQYWIRYDAIERALPYTVNWSVQSYEIFLSPTFKLKGERIEENERLIEQGRKNKKKKNEDIKPIVANENLDNQFLASFKNTWSKDSNSSALRLENLTDVNGGSLYLGAIITDGEKETEWNYETYTSDSFEYIRFGSGNIPEKSALNAQSSKTSFFFDKIETSEATNRFTIETQVRSDSIVDLYINGFYIKTVNVDSFGNIYEPNIKGSPGDRVTLRVYGSDGSYREIPYSVGGDSSYMLSSGELDYELYGDVDNDVYSLSASYGVTDGLTVGIMTEKANDVDYNQANLTYQYNYWSVFRLKASDSYFFGSSDIRYFEKSPIYFEYLEASEISQDLKYQESYFKVEQNWGLGRLSNENAYTLFDQGYVLDNIIRYKVDLKKTLVLQNTYDSKSISDKNTTLVQLNETINESGSWDIGYKFTENSRLLSASIKYKYTDLFESIDADNYITMSAKYDGRDFNYIANIDWSFGEYLTGNVSFSPDVVTLGLEFSLTRANHDERTYGRSKFGKASVDGYLLTNDMGTSSPIEGVRVTVSGDTVTTDKDGYYSFDEVPSNSVVNMHINETDLDIDLALTQNNIPIETRPATKIKHNVFLKPVVGIDGYVQVSGVKQLYIVNEEFDYKKKLTLEEDGFFTSEGIPSSTGYKLQALNEENDIIKEIVINLDKEYWYSDILLK